MDAFSIHGTIKAPVRRIISLAPSVTEMLFWLGLGESVVGVTRQCDYPPAAGGVENVGSFLIPDTRRILELRPDMVVGIGDLHRHLPDIVADGRPGIVLCDYQSVPGVLDVMEAVASLAVHGRDALERVAALRHRVQALAGGRDGNRPVRTFFLISEAPIMVPSLNSYQYDALKIAGASQLPTGYVRYERVTLEEVVHFDPEVILACGRHRGQPPPVMCPDCRSPQPICRRIVEDIALRPGWRETSAARLGNIRAIPCHWLCRPGPRLIDGMEAIAGIIKSLAV